MPQATPALTAEAYRARIAKVQQAMKEFGLQAIVLESGPAMQYLTGVRWGRSERTFAVVITQKGDPAYVLPAFEEMRARELIKVGDDIRVWQEDEGSWCYVGPRGDGRDGAILRVRWRAQAGAEDELRQRAARAESGRRGSLSAGGAWTKTVDPGGSYAAVSAARASWLGTRACGRYGRPH